MDFTIVCGYRNEGDQERAFSDGRSMVHWPDGKHNSFPSEAMDLVPYINGQLSWNKFHCYVFAGIVLAVAGMLGVNLRWGGNWDMDGEPITDQDFQDLAHYELIEE